MNRADADAGLRPLARVRVLSQDGGVGDAPALEGREMTGRIRLVLGAFLCTFCLLGLRLAYVSFGMKDEVALVRAERGEVSRPDVLDRQGRPLVMNRETEGLAIDGRDVWDVEETVQGVASVLPGVDTSRLRQRLSEGRYAFVRQSLTPDEKAAVVALGLPGMRFPQGEARVYPHGSVGAHVLGYTIAGRGGVVGVERILNDTKEGASAVRLTLDLAAQQVLEDELSVAMDTFSAKAAWGVLMDARDGSVVALASLPDYDPNMPGASPAAHRRNRAMSDAYELGSAFKTLTIAAAVDAGLIKEGERFDVSKPIRVGDWSISDFTAKPHPLTAGEVLQYSSNIGTVQIVQRLGAQGFETMLDELGLKTPLETDLPESRTPMLPARWGEAELATASYGQGIAVTPLQLAAATAAVVNGGVYHTPRFLMDTPVRGRQVFSQRTAASMRMALRRVVTDGTGGNAEAVGYHVIGKTSTADKPGSKGYGRNGVISSFVGAFPGYDPAYVMIVSLDDPEGIAETYGFRTAGYNAAPVFRRVVERVAPTLGLMPVGDEVAFDGFVGLRRSDEPIEGEGEPLDALAALLAEAAL
ncbi:peptidoglycan D,D-transpeptidase FtsI family protein [Parvularcula dongshanensis]|uniref:Cell division protein FtsI (Penicillin-binding protein 3) n=1 Tax=Parvularcula dongshanensis TaxID=1173995 RepID=A0A840I6S4_9PROT|nr:penicillin-binding protein 2 [Parvularcula dongshanensis]MBB4659874.1 cell division protein FtsI (penicillin-binding protein 3) [Parvularcula dongshanensis]